MVIELNSTNFQAEVKDYQETVLVDFYATWCGPCKMQAPIVEELSEQYQDIKFCKLNVDEAIDIAKEYSVMSIPTIMIMKEGEITYKQPGLLSADEISELLK